MLALNFVFELITFVCVLELSQQGNLTEEHTLIVDDLKPVDQNIIISEESVLDKTKGKKSPVLTSDVPPRALPIVGPGALEVPPAPLRADKQEGTEDISGHNGTQDVIQTKPNTTEVINTTTATSTTIKSTPTTTTTTTTTTTPATKSTTEYFNITSQTSWNEREQTTEARHVNNVTVTTESIVLSTEDLGACASSPCLHHGRCTAEGKIYTCQCGTLNNVQYGGYNCETKVVHPPVVHSIYPSYGPAAGGTAVTIVGSSLSLPVDGVYLGNEGHRYRCDVIKTNGTLIIFRTPEARSEDINEMLLVTVEFAGGARVNRSSHNEAADKDGGMAFQYRTNPVIMSAHPLQTLVRGGTTLYVHGHHLDSVAVPVVKVLMVLRRRTDQGNLTQTDSFYGECLGISNTTFSCQLPLLEIPDRFIYRHENQETTTSTDFTTAPNTQTDNVTALYDVITTDVINQTSDVSKNRPIRSQPEDTDHKINFEDSEEQLDFYLGFIMDGYYHYKDLREVSELQSYSRLEVFLPPHIFPGPGAIQYEEELEIIIKGHRLLRGIHPVDYSVTVGGQTCVITNLNDNTLVCTPPSDQLQQSLHGGEYDILVHFGTNTPYTYGVLVYSGVNIALIVGPVIGGVVLVALVVLIALLIRRHKCKPTNNRKKYTYSPVDRVLPPPITMDVISEVPHDKDSRAPFHSFHPDILRTQDDEDQPRHLTPTTKGMNGHIRSSAPELRTNPQKTKSVSSMSKGDHAESVSDLDDIYINKSGIVTKKPRNYENLGSRGDRTDGSKSNTPKSKKGKDYANVPRAKMSSKRNVPLPELPPEVHKRSHKSSPSKDFTYPSLNTFSPHKTLPNDYQPPVGHLSRTGPSKPAIPEYSRAPQRGGHHLYRGNTANKPYNSDSEEEEDIYMNSPIKARNFRKSGGRSKRDGRPRGATLWY